MLAEEYPESQREEYNNTPWSWEELYLDYTQQKPRALKPEALIYPLSKTLIVGGVVSRTGLKQTRSSTRK